MKLKLKISNAEPRFEKIRLTAGLVELFDAYMEYYKKQLNAAITSEQVMIEMVTAFIKSDRAFMRWYREHLVQDEKITE